MTGGDVTLAAGGTSVTMALIGPVVHSQGSGWAETPRPLMKAMPEWTGKPLDRVTLPCLLDEWDTGASIDDAVEALKGLMRRPGGASTPPTVTCRGPRLPFDPTAHVWVVDGVEWGDDQVFDDAGQMVRQDLTVTLLEQPRDEPTVVRVSRAARRDITLARAGDTLEKVARRELGDAKKWTTLRRLNPDIRPGVKIPAGRAVVIP